MLDEIVIWVNARVIEFTQLWPDRSFFSFGFNVTALLAVLFVCLICGAMGALVVGNRMAFFSDALAHCAFLGVGVGLAVALLLRADLRVFHQRVFEIMIVFGVATGVLIAFVRERTGLASDTVIGVFYAASIGLGAVFMSLVNDARLFSLEQFIFGDPVTAPLGQVLALGVLAVVVLVFLWLMYNHLILTSASSSLALSRRVPVRWCQYLLVVVLALTVNLSLFVVGALLINGMLIVPAAAAANLARNLRQMFWYSIIVALVAGVGGYLLSWEIGVRLHSTRAVGAAGSIVVLAVLLFVASSLVGRWLRDRPQPAEEAEQDA